MPELTDAQLDELERLAERASPGGYAFAEARVRGGTGTIAWMQSERDAAYIAAADPPTVLALVREVRRLRGAYARQQIDPLELYLETDPDNADVKAQLNALRRAAICGTCGREITSAGTCACSPRLNTLPAKGCGTA